MDLYVLDKNLELIDIIDEYESFIWTDRYSECGDFELYAAASQQLVERLKLGYFIQNRLSNHVMIVEEILIKADVEEGNHLTITGRSLESILDRRIIWGLKTVSGNLQNSVKTLLNECIISPSDSNRKISNFIFEDSADPTITGLSIEAQYTGDNLYDVIKAICSEADIGFQITLNDSKQFVFKLYAGADRSYDQSANPYVVFSPKFENLSNSNYIESDTSLKNVTLVGGEGEGAERKYTTVGSGSGLERRELFTDARDISSDIGDGVTLTPEEYTSQLQQRGKEKLAETQKVTSFDGTAETSVMYEYGVDYFNGDIVQIANEYGHEGRARVIETIISEDETGTFTYPTFKTI